MLTSCKLTGAAGAVSAYHTKEENYYFSQGGGVEAIKGDTGAQAHIKVHGGLCDRLGLKAGETISQDAFTNLLSGRDAAGNQITADHKVHGIDLVFSAPKSVSVAGLLTERDPRIIEAHDRAVLATMREIEKHFAGTRVRTNGSLPKPVHTGNMAFVTVRDGFNRDHDPHLHTHVVVMNMTELAGRVLSLDGRRIMAQDFNHLGGAMYRANLAAELKELGYSVSYTKKGELRLDIVSLEVERAYSGRRVAILAEKEKGTRDQAAWRTTRKEKDPSVNKRKAVEAWFDRLATFRAKTPEQNRAEAVKEREAWCKEAQWSVEARQELSGERGQTEAARWQAAARRATDRNACPGAEAVITEYLTEVARGETWERITYTEAHHRLQDQVRAGNLLATEDGHYTTWELTRADRECLADRKSLTVRLSLETKIAARQVAAYSESTKAAGRRGLSDIQAAAAAEILAAQRGVVVVQGDAGAGKTTMLKAVNEVAAAAGWEVVGIAVQGVAARNLEEESGIKSATLTSYMAREQARGGGGDPETRKPRLAVIDEASMLDSRGLAAFLRNAEQHSDKVVLVGDRNQLQAIGAGKPFERLVEAAETKGELVSLTENYRQRNPELRKAVALAREGKMRESIDALNRQGRVLEIPDQALRRYAVARQYDTDTLIITGRRDAREQINGMVRQDLVERGIVDTKTVRTYELAWKDDDGVRHSVRRELARGDLVTFLENESRVYDVCNGHRGEVVATAKGSLTVRMEDGRQIQLDLGKYNTLDYGYALTTYKSQGKTINNTVVDADTRTPQLQDLRSTYVQITRSRDDVRIYTDDKAELRELAGVLNSKQDTNELNVTLADARAMEARLRDMARQEASAKVAQAPAPAQEPEVQRLDFSEIRVHNQALLDSAGAATFIRTACLEQFKQLEERLLKRDDLTGGEKHRVAEYLSRPESAPNLDAHMSSPDEAIAAALVRSGTRDFSAATKGLPEHVKDELQHFLNREQSKGQGRDRHRDRDSGLGRGV